MRSVRCTWTVLALIALSPTGLVGQAQTSRLAGRILSSDGSAVVGAQISVGSSLLAVPSDSAGRFVVDAAPVGQVRVQARVIGHAPLDTTVTIQAGDNASVTLRMARNVQQLAPVVTEAVLPYGKPLRYQHTGRFDDFYERRARRPGTFFTREDIERSGRNSAMEIMASAPGVRINRREDGFIYVRVARCEGNSIWNQKRPPEERHLWLALFINGQRIGGETASETLSLLKADEIETMEVYRGPSQLPLEAVGNACAAVFITTRFTSGSVLTNK